MKPQVRRSAALLMPWHEKLRETCVLVETCGAKAGVSREGARTGGDPTWETVLMGPLVGSALAWNERRDPSPQDQHTLPLSTSDAEPVPTFRNLWVS